MHASETSQESDEPRRGAGLLARIVPLFWLSTYAVFSFQGRLLEQPTSWIYPKRLATITLGTFFFWAAIRLQDRLRHERPAIRAGAAVLASFSGAAALLAFRGIYSQLMAEPSSLARDTRWILTWIGYFLAWLGIYVTLAFQPRNAAPAVPAPEAPPASEPTAAGEHDDLWVHRGQQLVRAPLETIDWVRAEGNYVRVHAAGGSGVLRASLSEIERRLARHDFVRVHRSVLCRGDRIRAVRRERTGAFVATLACGTEIPVGRRYGKPVIDSIRGRDSEPA